MDRTFFVLSMNKRPKELDKKVLYLKLEMASFQLSEWSLRKIKFPLLTNMNLRWNCMFVMWLQLQPHPVVPSPLLPQGLLLPVAVPLKQQVT